MAFSTLFKITPEPIGLELSDRSIKAVKLSKRREYFNLEDFMEVALPEGLLKDGVIQSEKKLSNILKKSVDFKNGNYVSCSLPEQQTYLRVVQLPIVSDMELENAIQWELEANIPLSLEEVYFDWEVIRGSVKKNHFDILVSAVPKNIVDSYVSLFKGTGLKLFSLEPESIALARGTIFKGINEKAVMVVDIGLTHSLFMIYAAGSVRFASSVPAISGSAMTQAISKSLNVGLKEAEKFKKELGLNKDKNIKVSESLTPAISALRKQIKEYIKFYEAHAEHTHDNSIISSILLSGGDSLLLGLEENLSSFLKIPVEKARPGENIFGPKYKISLGKGDLLRYSTTLGLAAGGMLSSIK